MALLGAGERTVPQPLDDRAQGDEQLGRSRRGHAVNRRYFGSPKQIVNTGEVSPRAGKADVSRTGRSNGLFVGLSLTTNRVNADCESTRPDTFPRGIRSCACVASPSSC